MAERQTSKDRIDRWEVEDALYRARSRTERMEALTPAQAEALAKAEELRKRYHDGNYSHSFAMAQAAPRPWWVRALDFFGLTG